MSMRSSVIKTVVLIGFLGLFAGTASADAPPWTYVELGYLGVDFDDLEGTGDNWFVGGAFGAKNWHVIGQYGDGDASDNLDRTDWRLGAGWHGLLGEKADVLAEAYYVSSEIGPFSEYGYRVVGGVRWRVIKLFEVDGFINYTDVDEVYESITSYELRAMVNIWRVAIGAGYETSSDVNQYNVFARFNFK